MILMFCPCSLNFTPSPGRVGVLRSVVRRAWTTFSGSVDWARLKASAMTSTDVNPSMVTPSKSTPERFLYISLIFAKTGFLVMKSGLKVHWPM